MRSGASQPSGIRAGRGIEPMSAILLVDDDTFSRTMAAHILGRNGYLVHEACEGREAMRILRRFPEITTLISDLLMPDMDGLELIQAARALRPGLRIVAMSAGGHRFRLDLVPAALSLGADIGLHKPLDAARLTAALPPPGEGTAAPAP